ncbi:MAG: Oxidoreductase [Parcubacteria group bacterium GW2011_GWA2_47_8b]|nr:MAG: Oxidoreductase [Parcubacteria group bacterium GW2011_GWA2_47_8b]
MRGEIAEDDETRDRYSRDASLFEIKPKAVIFPKDTEDVKNLVKYVVKEKQNDPGLSLTGEFITAILKKKR